MSFETVFKPRELHEIDAHAMVVHNIPLEKSTCWRNPLTDEKHILTGPKPLTRTQLRSIGL